MRELKRGRGEEDEPPRKKGGGREKEENVNDWRAQEGVRRAAMVNWRRAEEVFKEVSAWLKGKYVTVHKAGEGPKFMGYTLDEAKAGTKASRNFTGTCMECGATGHKAVECPKDGGKFCVPPLRLYEKRMVNAQGVAVR